MWTTLPSPTMLSTMGRILQVRHQIGEDRNFLTHAVEQVHGRSDRTIPRRQAPDESQAGRW
jgi:hypothetical protein